MVLIINVIIIMCCYSIIVVFQDSVTELVWNGIFCNIVSFYSHYFDKFNAYLL